MKLRNRDLSPASKPIIWVWGVGGGGCNAVAALAAQNIPDINLIVSNTDSQALDISPIPTKVLLGEHLTRGLGAGANPEMGAKAALENKEEIRDILSNGAKMLFITAGMGGGTGTGAAPIIAEIARELGILTVGIVTMPFGFEGKPKMAKAIKGLAELEDFCDTTITILNENVRAVYGKCSMREAFAHADNVVALAVKGIALIITKRGNINVDFEDIRTVLTEAFTSVMTFAIASGKNRAEEAIKNALTSPLIANVNLLGSKYLLLSIESNDDLTMDELQFITDYCSDLTGNSTELILGVNCEDTTLAKGELQVTLIATGFPDVRD